MYVFITYTCHHIPKSAMASPLVKRVDHDVGPFGCLVPDSEVIVQVYRSTVADPLNLENVTPPQAQSILGISMTLPVSAFETTTYII